MTERTFWNEAYQQDAEHTAVPDRVLHEEIRTLLPGRALDIGCGTGENALFLARHGWDVTGIDWCDQAVFLAERAAWKEGVQIRFEIADAAEWSTQKPFDLVLVAYALPPGGHGVAVIRQASRALAPGGTLIIADWHQSMADRWECSGCELHTPDRIVAAVSGLEVERAETRRIPDLFPSEDPRARHGTWADVAIVRARRPGEDTPTKRSPSDAAD